MASAALLVLLALAVSCVHAGGPGRRHFRGPFIPGRVHLPLIPLRPFPPPFFFKGNIGPRRFPGSRSFVNRQFTDFAQPFPFTSYQTPFDGAKILDNRGGVPIPLNGPIGDSPFDGAKILDNRGGIPIPLNGPFGDFGFDNRASAAASASAIGGGAGFDFLGGGSANAAAAAAAGVSGGGGLGGIDYLDSASSAAASAAGVGGYDLIGGGPANAAASASATAVGAGGLDLIGGPTVVGFNDNGGRFDSGIGGFIDRGGRRDYRDDLKRVSLDSGYDNRYDNGGKRVGLDNGYDNGGRRSGFDNDNGRLRGSYDNGRDDNSWKYGRDNGFGSVVVDGGDTTVVHVSRPGDNGFISTGPGAVYGSRVTYDGGPDAIGTAAASASASAATATNGAGGLKYDTGLIDLSPGIGQGLGVASSSASASAAATSQTGTSGLGLPGQNRYDLQLPLRGYNPNIVVVSGNGDDGKVKVVV